MRSFLDLLVRKFIARQFVAYDQIQAVPGSEVTLVVDGKIAQRARIRIVLRDHGIQIMVAHAAAGARANGILAPDILPLREDSGRIETSSRKHHVAMEARLHILERVDLNYASHFAAIFRGDARGIDGYGLHVIGFQLGPEAGRTVVGQRDSIDYELRLILRAARMQHGVAFVEPARLIVDEILHGASRNGGDAVLNFLQPDLADRASLVGIDEGIGSVDVDHFTHR